MTPGPITRWLAPAAVLALALLARPAAACPFCPGQGATLTTEASQASMILFGTLSNPQLAAGGDFGQGTTELHIDLVVKPHDILAGRKVLTLNRYVQVDKDNPVKYLVFCDVYQGKIDPYRGVAVKPDSPVAEYLKGALAVKEKDAGTRLRYFFQYLQSPDLDVANDAYTEYGNLDYKDLRPVAEKLPADVLVRWLSDPNTLATRYGLYGSMLGHCGGPKDAAVLRKLLDDPQRRFSSGMDGVLAGYVMLDHAAGWQYLAGILKNTNEQMLVRYAALRAARFFYDFRPDVIPQSEVVSAVDVLLDQSDIADLVIEDLRKWGRWEKTDRVLGLFGKPSHDVMVIKRSILRFALSCPPDKSPKAVAFVAEQRKRDPEWVADAEELLRLETAPRPATPPPAPTKPGGAKTP